MDKATLKLSSKPVIPELGDCVESLKTEGSKLLSQDSSFYWIGLGFFKLYSLYKSKAEYLRRQHCERTYDAIWELVDRSFDDTVFYLTRGEVESSSIKNLRNKGRTLDFAIRTSPKFDGRIFSFEEDKGVDTVEYGFLEVDRRKATEFGTKHLFDQGKIVKGMCASFDDSEKGRLRIGIQTSGLQLRVLVLFRGGGNVKILRRFPKVEIPRTYDKLAIGKAFFEIARARAILVDGLVGVTPRC